MDATIKKVELSIPETDLPLLKELADKFRWTIRVKESDIEKDMEDMITVPIPTYSNPLLLRTPSVLPGLSLLLEYFSGKNGFDRTS